MADTKITELTELTAIAPEGLVVVVDDVVGTPTTKKATEKSLVNARTVMSIVPAANFSRGPGTSVQSAFAILATKSVGSSRSHTSHSKNTEEKRQPALTSVSQSKEIPAYNELAAAYLNSLMTSVGSVTATKT